MTPTASDDAVRTYVRMLRATTGRVRAATYRDLVDVDATHAFVRLDCRAVVAVGARDRITPPAVAQEVANLLPGLAGHHELPGVGHATPLESSDAVNLLLDSLVGDGSTG